MEQNEIIKVDTADISPVNPLLIDIDKIIKGESKFCIPDGVKCIDSGAFVSYNEAPEIIEAFDRITRHEYHLVEWKKILLAKRRFRKVYVPKEHSSSTHEKAEYLTKQDSLKRMLSLYIPASVSNIEPNGMPFYLQTIQVSEENPNFRSVDGVVMDKDCRVLVRYPGCMENPTYTIPEGIERIEDYAFENARIDRLIVPSSVKEFGENCFRGCFINELILEEGIEVVKERVFSNCSIKKINLPSSLKFIESYAFEEIYDLSEIQCASDDLNFGVGVFSKSNLANIDMWCWSVIPKATFINSNIKDINIPEGVSEIGDYAFAGCYRTKSITLPSSVDKVGVHSFELGNTAISNVSLSCAQMKYAFHFPILSKINKKTKLAALKSFSDQMSFEKEALIRYKENCNQCLASLSATQIVLKKELRDEVAFIDKLL